MLSIFSLRKSISIYFADIPVICIHSPPFSITGLGVRHIHILHAKIFPSTGFRVSLYLLVLVKFYSSYFLQQKTLPKLIINPSFNSYSADSKGVMAYSP